MKTLNFIKNLVDEYVNAISSIDSKTEEEYKYRFNSIREHFVGLFNELRDAYPELLQYNYNDVLQDDEADRIVNRITQNASKRYSSPFLPTGNVVVDRIMDDVFVTPTFVPWQCEGNRKQNFVIAYNDEMFDMAKSMQATLLQNMLMCFVSGKIHFNIFDFSMTGMSDVITSQYDPEIYNGRVIMEADDAFECIMRLRERMQDVMQKYGDMARYNERLHKIEMPYEIVVLNDYPERYKDYTEQMQPLFENGHRGGIYFVVMHNTSAKKLENDVIDLLFSENKNIIPFQYKKNYEGSLVNYTPLSNKTNFIKHYAESLSVDVKRPERQTVLKQDFFALKTQGYKPVISEISVTVGVDIENNQQVTFRLNSKDYIHAFILGQSGSGKSVLLNNIITSVINKYSPEDVMMYLMDFKGVEFNRYRGVKHAKAILVDNSDPQMTLEVLRELKEENRQRVKLFQQENVNNIDGYNTKNQYSRLPQVLFVADECQVMFSRIDAGENSYAIQREIADIIKDIARQGRSQGIHMLLATQQLDGTDISNEVLNNLTECFLLMSAPTDSNQLVPDSSDITVKQPVGQCCYFHKKELKARMQTYYATDNELARAIDESKQKASTSKSNGEAYFKGSSMYFWDDNEQNEMLGNKKDIVAAVGRNIGIKGTQTIIPLYRDLAENVLFFGANKEEQTVGVVMNALISLISSLRNSEVYCQIKVIDCDNTVDKSYKVLLNEMQDKGLCEIVDRKGSGQFLYDIAKEINEGMASPTILVVIGSEHFMEVKRNFPLLKSGGKIGINKKGFDISNGVVKMEFYCNEDGSTVGFEEQIKAQGEQYAVCDVADADEPIVKTFPEALRYILDEGPMQGVHILLQVDKPSNIFFEEYPTDVATLFKHKVILRSENNYLTSLQFSKEIDVETLGDEKERLRAYYYPEGGDPQLFTPYLMPNNV